ncbi:lipoyl synthase [Candidatus Binatia bacterium]|nr:lipoyl synthase [Candidatus Binatia bacterium]
MSVARRHPEWIKVKAPGGPAFFATKRIVKELRLHTVCEEAHCPNVGECWGHRTATFMLLGEVCTRNCAFCAVVHGRPDPVDPLEPARVAEGVVQLGLRHVVVTSVDRDDLPDGGAGQFVRTAQAIRARVPECRIEVLVPDFRPDIAGVDLVVDAPIDILNHNVETVPRLYRRARPGASYARSLEILGRAKSRRPELLTKTGLMLGLGEEQAEVRSVLRDLVGVGCDILTLGQYLRPSAAQMPVARYLEPSEFVAWRSEGLACGFRHVEAGPLVRSSYHAWTHVP